MGAFVRGVSLAGGVLACVGAIALLKGGRRGSESKDEKAEGVRRAEPCLKGPIDERLEPRHGIAAPPKRPEFASTRGFSRFAVKKRPNSTCCGKAEY